MALTRRRRLRPTILALTAVLALAACDTAEERAEKHFQNAVALLEKGDIPRARVELQNVFKLNGQHRGARATMARTLLAEGNLPESFSQYLRLVEQYPDDIEGRLMLSELGIILDNWQAAEPHVKALTELAPDSPRAQVVITAMDYRTAVLDDEPEDRQTAARRAKELKPALPDSVINRAVIIDSLVLDGDNLEALKEIEEVQELAPGDRRFYQMRLGVLTRLDDQAGIEETLLDMVERFPDDLTLAQTLISYYNSRGDSDGAEAFLRSRFTEGDGNNDARVALIRFLTEFRDRPTAIAQADRFVEEGTNNQLFRSLRATLMFDNGIEDEAVAELEDILRTAEPSDETNEIKVTLAQILGRTGNEVGARALIEEVLEADPSNVNGLRIKALWQIQDDNTDQAIILLRRALDQEPRNSEVLTTMAEAHLRNGERELAGEMLALSVEASNRGISQSLDYARFLIGETRYTPAESVLTDALKLNPGNLALLTELTRVYIAVQDWPRAEQIERSLREDGSPQAISLADRVRVSILRAQQRDSDAIAFLETLSDDNNGNRAAEIAIVRAHLENGDGQSALNYIQELVSRDPEDRGLRFIMAAVMASVGQLDNAVAEYRALIDAGAASPRVFLELVRVQSALGDSAAAEATVAEGLETFPEAGDLLWMQASFAEQRQEFDKAIEIYERLYEQNTATSVIANNLASLLSTTKTDQESLDRAWRIARRLRDSDFAPYQDTYGWIAYRKGNYDEAISNLEPAAQGLPLDPLVHFHLGMAYNAAFRSREAQETLERALELAGDDPRPAFDTARETLAEIANRGNTAPATGD